MTRAIVVGGTQGIGAATVELLRASDYEEVVTFSRSRQSDLGVDAVSSKPVRHLSFDFATGVIGAEEFEKLELNGFFQSLVVTVGSGRPSSEILLGEKFIDSTKRNVLPVLNAIQSFLPLMDRASGSIVVVSSIAAYGLREAPQEYVATKAALNSYVRSFSNVISPVRINAVAAGNVNTTNSPWPERLRTDPEGLHDYLAINTALGRLATPREIAEVIVFLASPRASFTTGSIWDVDGGQSSSL